mmetsp:Transcript_3921/g.9528  ORF Transcript_3921/g.9528 Transcript_3921/m.9528 type:complete len:228 (+) Transcript_3921:139-822(+)
MGKDYSKKDIAEVFGYALTHPKQIPDELMEPLCQKWKAEVKKRTETWVCLNVGKVNQVWGQLTSDSFGNITIRCMELQQNNFLTMVEHSQIFSFVQPVIQMKICTHLGLSGSLPRDTVRKYPTEESGATIMMQQCAAKVDCGSKMSFFGYIQKLHENWMDEQRAKEEQEDQEKQKLALASCKSNGVTSDSRAEAPRGSEERERKANAKHQRRLRRGRDHAATAPAAA